jgi:hypothetical protein
VKSPTLPVCPLCGDRQGVVFAHANDRAGRVLIEIGNELAIASAKHRRPLNSPHEGFAVIREEVDELWEAVRRDDLKAALAEAVQVGAMAVRFLVDLERDDP